MAVLSVHSDAGRVSLEGSAIKSVRELLDATSMRVNAACGGVGTCGACTVRLTSGRVNPPTSAERQKLTAEERGRGIRLACQLRCEGDAEIELENPAPPSPWRSIPMGEPEDCSPRPVAVGKHPYGLAVDLGTTHIRVALWDRGHGRRIATRWAANPQGVWGADVLNRLGSARVDAGRALEMAGLARGSILEALQDILARDVGEVDAMLGEIGRVVIVGNTAMLALLTGQGGAGLLDPANWQRPIDISPPDPSAWAAQWRLPNAEILLPQPLAGFVGSDLLATVAATRLLEGPPGSLLLDVGTNTEIALWDGTVLHVSSVPGGPAFEGAGTRFGTSAGPGAIDRVASHPDGTGPACRTLGGLEARGFCGSGLIDAVALLLEAGTLKPSGRFAEPAGPGGRTLDPSLPRSAVAAGDVDAFQRAKAAHAAAMAGLLDIAGLQWGSIARLCLCGAFGASVNIGHAQAVGLLPKVATGHIELHPHAALAGCERALLANQADAEFKATAGRVKPVNFASIEGWEDRYMEHLLLAPIALETHPRTSR